MRRLGSGLVVAAVTTLGLGAGPAGADVHGISQAGCAASANSGATMSRDAPGRPAAPIPVSASPFLTTADFPGEGGDGDPFCDVPPGPPKN